MQKRNVPEAIDENAGTPESRKVTQNLSPTGQRNFAFAKIRSSSIDAAAKRGMFTARNPGMAFDNNASAKNLVSVSQIRQSRHKVELDVMRLHNRIQLLEAEEERANKIIEDTKNKVKKIMKSRAANGQFQKDLVRAREKEMKAKQA